MKMVNLKLTLCTLLLIASVGALSAQELIPTPVEISYKGKKRVKIENVDAKVEPSLDLPQEGYTLEIKGTTALLRAKTAQGLVWAKATLAQLHDKEGLVRIVKIKDYPAFPIRGFMHDTGRNFRPVEMLKQELDLFSAYKLNVFHWHLTDNPAWRIESKCYPQLNDAKYCPAARNPGKFYTYDEIRDVIKYAKERGITIIPELDIPGHSQYFWTIFGCYMESEKGMKILDKLFAEFFAEIPAEDCPYIHIGSDEVRRKMKDAEGFVRHYEQMLAKHNRIPIVWDPGIKPSPTTVCQIWNEAIKNSIAESKDYKNPYLDSYMGYLNHSNLINNIHRNFLHQMCTVESGTERALGGILCLWNDVRLASPEQLFPINGMPIVMLPFAERSWVGGKGYGLDYDMLVPSPENQGYHDLVAFEKKMVYHRDHNLRDWDIRWVANAHIPWQVTIPQAKGTKMEDMQWTKAYGGSVNLYALGKQHGVKQANEMVAWLKTEIYSEEDREIRAWVSLETPSRSTRRSAGIGEQGKWETGGTVLLNGEEVVPPVAWNEPGAYAYHFSTYKYVDIQNLPWTNEQLFWMREPAKLKLKKGWNTLLIEAPLHYKTPFWYVSFTPVEVGADGRLSEVKGLQYR
ncbi:MAG: family 20 glycosylhydrolase [Alistipes sp.]|nr:family 20 glycosylhydrolase [Alistipes sp.]